MKNFSERKSLLSYMLLKKKARSWSMQTKPPAAELDGKDVSTVLEIMGTFIQ